jgi:hypothetical protein
MAFTAIPGMALRGASASRLFGEADGCARAMCANVSNMLQTRATGFLACDLVSQRYRLTSHNKNPAACRGVFVAGMLTSTFAI